MDTALMIFYGLGILFASIVTLLLTVGLAVGLAFTLLDAVFNFFNNR